MGKLIRIYNEGLNAEALVPKNSLRHYEERGWVNDEVAPNAPGRVNDLEVDDNALESDEYDIDQEE